MTWGSVSAQHVLVCFRFLVVPVSSYAVMLALVLGSLQRGVGDPQLVGEQKKVTEMFCM